MFLLPVLAWSIAGELAVAGELAAKDPRSAVRAEVLPVVLHATMLHLMRIDHEKLTHHDSGRDYHLTDVEDMVIKEIPE